MGHHSSVLSRPQSIGGVRTGSWPASRRVLSGNSDQQGAIDHVGNGCHERSKYGQRRGVLVLSA